MLTILAVFLLLFFTALYYHFFEKRRHYPPGPIPLPLVGNLLQLDPVNPHETVFKWSRKYGPIFTIWLGPRPTVVITGYDIMKKYVAGKWADLFAGRPENFLFEHFQGGGR